MTAEIRTLVEAMFAGVSAQDVDAATAGMADNVEIFDPHYPYPTMYGIAQVREGITWAFGGMKSMDFDIERWFSADDGLCVVVEVSTHHVLRVGNKHVDFLQVFVIDTDGSQITRMRAYEPYGPDGITGIGLSVMHAAYRLRHRRKS